MAKDPAFLFYSSDWITGTSIMTFEDRGKFITILSYMHQHNGVLTDETIRLLVGSVSDSLKSKFIIQEKNWRNKRLDEEIAKRSKFVESRQNNGKLGGRPKPKGKPKGKPKANRKVSLPVNEDVNENIVDNTNKIYKRCLDFYLEWYINRFKTKADFDGSDGVALKSTIKFLNEQPDNAGDEKVYATWTTMLSNFDKWEPFHQTQTRIRQINQFKSNIINHLKNGKPNSKATFAGVVAEMAKRNYE